MFFFKLLSSASPLNHLSGSLRRKTVDQIILKCNHLPGLKRPFPASCLCTRFSPPGLGVRIMHTPRSSLRLTSSLLLGSPVPGDKNSINASYQRKSNGHHCSCTSQPPPQKWGSFEEFLWQLCGLPGFFYLQGSGIPLVHLQPRAIPLP